MSKEVLNKQVGEWRKEVARLNDLIAHATGTQAAANKAAEEREPNDPELAKEVLLEDLESIVDYWTGTVVEVYGGKSVNVGNDLREKFAKLKFSAIASGRASRQVANKAEVEPSDSYKAGYADGMEEGAKLAFWGDKPSEKFPEGWPAEIWLNAGDDELGPFSEYDEVSWCSAPQGESDVRYIREDLLATPPATTGGASATPTGASTEELKRDAERHRYTRATTTAVRDPESGERIEVTPEMYDAAIDRAIADDPDFSKGIKSRHLVGASTVLTDERDKEIERLQIELAAVRDLIPIPEGGELHQLWAEACSDPFCVLGYVKGHLVAAQAGQVAVPEDVARDAARYRWLEERFTGFDFYWMGTPPYEAEEDKGKCVIVFECGQDFEAGRHFQREIDKKIALSAAPSPAKESK